MWVVGFFKEKVIMIFKMWIRQNIPLPAFFSRNNKVVMTEIKNKTKKNPVKLLKQT